GMVCGVNVTRRPPNLALLPSTTLFRSLLSITSRDPAPPPLGYVRLSGGLFRDVMIHDFDMARWLLGEEPVEVFAQEPARHVEIEIGRAHVCTPVTFRHRMPSSA